MPARTHGLRNTRWARITGLHKGVISYRLRVGRTIEQVLNPKLHEFRASS